MADNTPKQQQQDNKYANLRQVLNTQLPGNGPVVVKCRCGTEIRRIPIVNGELTFDELCIMMHRLFRKHLSNNTDNMILRYQDNEGDWISLTDDLDITHAISLNPVLHIQIHDKETMAGPDDADEIKALKVAMDRAHLKSAALKQLKKVIGDVVKQLQDLLSAIPDESKVGPSEAKPEDKQTAVQPAVKPLSTADMAELLDASVQRRHSHDAPPPQQPPPPPRPVSVASTATDTSLQPPKQQQQQSHPSAQSVPQYNTPQQSQQPASQSPVPVGYPAYHAAAPSSQSNPSFPHSSPQQQASYVQPQQPSYANPPQQQPSYPPPQQQAPSYPPPPHQQQPYPLQQQQQQQGVPPSSSMQPYPPPTQSPPQYNQGPPYQQGYPHSSAASSSANLPAGYRPPQPRY